MQPSAISKYQLTGLFYLVLLTLLVYFNMLAGSFHFDDQSLLSRAWISDIDHFRKQVQLGSVGNRPVLLLTYALNNSLNPNQVFGFHLVSLQLHVWAAILIFLILRRGQYFLSLRLPGLPLVSACLFAVHPLNTDAVSYISSRSAELATFLYLLTLYGFLALCMPGKSRVFKAGMGLFCLAGFYLAVASKLIAATLPLALAVWFWLAVNQGRVLRGVFAGTALAGCSAIAYLAWKGWFLSRDQGEQIFGRGAYFLLQCKVIVFYYIKKFLFPFNLNIDVGFPFSTFWTDAQIPLALAGIVGVIVYVFRRGNPYLKLATAWFFLALAPTSSFVPLNDLAVEHHTYLPLTLGLCLVLGWVVAQTSPDRRPVVLAVLLLSLGALTLERNRIWFDDLVLWADAAAKNPWSPRTQNNLGKALYEASGRHLARGETALAQQARDQALIHFKQAVANLDGFGDRFYNKNMFYAHFDHLAAPALKRQMNLTSGTGSLPNKDIKLLADFADPHYNIASVYLDLGRFPEAEQEYLAVIGIDPYFISAYLGLGSTYNQMGRFADAVRWYQEGLEKIKALGQADDPLFHLNLGEVYGKTGKHREALEELQQAVRLSPSLDKAHYNMGIIYTLLGEYDNAERSYLACLGQDSHFPEARFNLAALYQLRKEWDRSTQEFQNYLVVRGGDARAYFQIAWNHQQLERWAEARNFYARALELDPGYAKARANLDHISALLAEGNSR